MPLHLEQQHSFLWQIRRRSQRHPQTHFFHTQKSLTFAIGMCSSSSFWWDIGIMRLWEATQWLAYKTSWSVELIRPCNFSCTDQETYWEMILFKDPIKTGPKSLCIFFKGGMTNSAFKNKSQNGLTVHTLWVLDGFWQGSYVSLGGKRYWQHVQSTWLFSQQIPLSLSTNTPHWNIRSVFMFGGCGFLILYSCCMSMNIIYTEM